jgi:hypothetical protein
LVWRAHHEHDTRRDVEQIPSHAQGTSLWSACIGMPLATPNMRRSNTPTVQMSRHNPMKCNDSTVGQPHAECMKS